MKRLLKSPVVNAAGIIIFTAFYALVFFLTANSINFVNSLNFGKAASFWAAWSGFLADGNQQYIAYALIAVTVVVLIMLFKHSRSYDEYHTSILTNCLVIAAILTFIAIAAFFLMILNEPAGIIEKFMLFIVIHWSTVVLANLTFVLLCRRK